MKAIKILFGVIIVLALIGGSVVVAQEVDPPRPERPPLDPDPFPEWDETFRTRDGQEPPAPDPGKDPEEPECSPPELCRDRQDLSIMEERQPPGYDLETFPLWSDAEGVSPEFLYEKERELRDADAPREVYPASSTLTVAGTFFNEWWSDVAHGDGFYMVVYGRDGNIYAVVYSNDGDWQDFFTVKDCVGIGAWCAYPAIAYEDSSGLFLVAYEISGIDPTTNIAATAVSPVTGPVGFTYRYVIGSTDWYPSVACNPDNGSCLVAFQANAMTTRIRGTHWELDPLGISGWSGLHNLTNADNPWFPHLAWGNGTDRYLLTYNMTGATHDFPAYTHVYDEYVIGVQYAHLSRPLVSAADEFLVDFNKYNYGVAYDPCSRVFVASFYHDFWDDGSDYDVWAVAVHGQLAASTVPFPVTYTGHDEKYGTISFVTDDHLAPACGRMDKLVVAYHDQTNGVKAADLRGNSSVSNPLYDVDHAWDHLVVRPHSGSVTINSPIAISSGSQRAEMFVTYQPWWIAWGDYDIWGRIIEVRDRTYLPLIVR